MFIRNGGNIGERADVLKFRSEQLAARETL
jgi:hypothetical protein